MIEPAATTCPRCAGHQRRVRLLADELDKAERAIRRARDVVQACAERLAGGGNAQSVEDDLRALLDETRGI